MNPVIIVLCIIGGAGLILLLPLKGARSFIFYQPVRRVHEADTVLSRRLLVPGSKPYESYYKLHPEFQTEDDRSRMSPGLLDNNARHFQTGTFSAARANFEVIDFLGNFIHRPLPGSNTRKRCPDFS